MARPLLFAASTIFLFPLAIHGHTVCQTALERTFFGLALNDSHFMLMLNPTAGRSQHYLTIVLPKYRFICSITSCVLELHSSNLADITDEVSPNFPVAENKGTFLFAFNHTSGLARLYSNGSHFNWYPTGSNKSVRLDIDTAGSNFDLKEAARMSLFSSKSAGKFAYLTSGSNAIFEAKYTTEPSNKKKFHFAFTFTSDVLGKIIPKGNIQGGFYWNDQLVALDNAARKLYFYKLGSVKAVEAFRVLNYADFVQCSFDPTSDGSSTTVAGIKTWHAILVGVILLALGIAVGLCIIKRREHRGTIFSSEGSDPKGFRIAPTSGISLSTSSIVKTASVKIGQFKRANSSFAESAVTMCSPAVCSLLLLCLATQAVAFTPRNFCWSFPANYTLLGLGRLNASHLLVMGTDECQHSCAGNFSAYVVPRDRFRPLDDRSSPSLSLVGLNAIGLTFNSTDATDQEELTKLANSRGVFMIQTSVDSGLAIFNVTRIHYYPVKRGVSARYMVNDPIYSPLYLHRKALFSMEEPTKLAYLNQTQEGEPSLVQEAFYNASETEKVKDTKFTVMYPIIFRNTTTVHGSIASPGDIEGGFIYKNVLYALDNTHHKMVMFRLGSKTAVSPTREVAYADFFICQGPSEVPRDETTTGKIRPSQFGLFLALGLVLLATAIIGFFILRISRGRKKRSKSTLPKRTSKIQSKPNIKAKDQNLAPAIYANAKHCKSQLGSKAAHTARSFLATTSGGTLRSKASRTNQTLPSSPNSISSSLIKVPTKSIHIPGKAHQPHSQLPKTGSLLNDSFSTAFK